MEANDSGGLVVDMRALIAKHKWLVDAFKIVISFITGACTAIVTVHGYIHKEVDTIVEKELKPYDNMLIGLGHYELDEYDDALPSFVEISEADGFAKLPKKFVLLVYDRLLCSLANCSDPKKYAPKFLAVQKYLLGEVHEDQADGWRYYQMGWYLMRTGNEKGEGTQRFMEAIKWYDDHHRTVDAADSVWGLMIVTLAENNLPKADKLAEDLASRNPRDYGRVALIDKLKTVPQQQWFTSLSLYLNPELPKVVEGFRNGLEQREETEKQTQ